MFFRTDLALEIKEKKSEELQGVKCETSEIKDVSVTKIKILTKGASKILEKPVGEYITIQVRDFSDNKKETEFLSSIVSKYIKKFIPNEGLILVVGLGNLNITPDSLGPKACETILATRHIRSEFSKVGIDILRSVAVISPGVLGQTGIEVLDIIKSLVKEIKPEAVVLIDALASKDASRLAKTIQISNTGISPGSGVSNSRPSINKKSIGIDVVSIGIPMVIDATTIAADILGLETEDELKSLKEKVSLKESSLMVTPRDIDVLVDRSAKLLGMSVNLALQGNFDFEDFPS
ncbi:MAG: GPR endopeptidase [Oscillospiraceae bacterium]|jgi:spore protease|nr:GPR endopeptidase [Oscillospiraceae bacterium]